MTDLRDSHLDDEALSAALDGEATPDEQAHLALCGPCRDRLALLEDSARAVAAPVVPPSPAAVDRAIATALAAWAPPAVAEPGAVVGGLAGGVSGGVVGGGATAPAVDGASRAKVPTGQPAPWTRSRPTGPTGPTGPTAPRRLPVAAAVSGLAAAIVIVAGVALVASRHSTRSNVASSETSATTLAAGSGTSPRLGPAIGVPAIDDLGSQSDPYAVAGQVQSALRRSSIAAADNQSPAAAGAANSTTTSAAPSARSASTSAAPTVPAANAGNGANPNAGAANSPTTSASPGQATASPCLAEARTALGLTGDPGPPVVYQATLQWRAQAAVVVVFRGPRGLAGEILTAGTCLSLVSLPF